jgi:predicted DNA-binding transcriptional regulator YafY
MRRADRLFQIVQTLRHRELITAAQLALHLEVSDRTIYRDIVDLQASGIPIDGEAGVGYRLSDDFELPPLMFTRQEVQALVLGARMVQSWGDVELQAAARLALDKVEAVLPESERAVLRNSALYSVSCHVPPERTAHMSDVRRAIDERRKLRIQYEDGQQQASLRVLQPLGLFFWGATWTLGAWCELRKAHRNFRLDRVRSAELLVDSFELEPPVTMVDYLRAVEE